MARNQLVGGAFQDADGNVLANGALTLQLSSDARIISGGQLGRGIKVSIPLDSNGNILGTVLLWPNDQLQPNGTFYWAEVFTAGGQSAWGPQFQTVLSSPSPFDLAAWLPTV